MNFFRDDPHSKDVFEYVRKYTAALQIGTLVHTHLLTPELLPDFQPMIDDIIKRFPSKPATYKEKIGKGGRVFKSKVQYKPSAIERVEAAVMKSYLEPDVMASLEGCKFEYAGVVEDYNGIKVRIKADALNFDTGILYDVKTSSKTPQAFMKDALSDQPSIPYYLQAFLYLDVANTINKLSGIDTIFTKFKWIFVPTNGEKQPVVIECPPELLEKGRKQVMEYCEAMRNGK